MLHFSINDYKGLELPWRYDGLWAQRSSQAHLDPPGYFLPVVTVTPTISVAPSYQRAFTQWCVRVLHRQKSLNKHKQPFGPLSVSMFSCLNDFCTQDVASCMLITLVCCSAACNATALKTTTTASNLTIRLQLWLPLLLLLALLLLVSLQTHAITILAVLLLRLLIFLLHL